MDEGVRHSEMAAILEAQRRAFRAEGAVPADRRRDRLDRAIALLVDHRRQLADAMAEDFGGRPEAVSLFADIAAAVKALRFARRHLRSWMRPRRRRLDFPLGLLGARGVVEYCPKGVVGVVSPWNFPVNLSFAPLAGILAAGNRAMIKPSEMTPATTNLMARLVADHFDRDEIAVVTGGPEAGRAFVGLPFDHLLFTGSTAVGRQVMRAAAENLTPVTLELGGKSPVVVSESADLAQAAERVVIGKMLNAGQICLAPDYMLVPEGQVDRMAELIADAAGRLYPRLDEEAGYTAIINDRHRTRLESLVADARAKGARVDVVAADGADMREGTNTGFMPLHILRDVSDAMAVMQEEIFGPLLPLVPYRGIETAIDYVDDRPRPLALYYFGRDRAEERRVLDHTLSGGVTLGDVLWHVALEDLPFGGIGPSGMGAYHGREGFETFSHARAVYRQTRFDIARLLGAIPPYGVRLRRVLQTQIKK